jgi:hypothetical protein
MITSGSGWEVPWRDFDDFFGGLLSLVRAWFFPSFEGVDRRDSVI